MTGLCLPTGPFQIEDRFEPCTKWRCHPRPPPFLPIKKHKMKCRLQHLRHYSATMMIQNGLLREEADLLQGRIGKTVFTQHYFSPNIENLKNRSLKIIQKISA